MGEHGGKQLAFTISSGDDGGRRQWSSGPTSGAMRRWREKAATVWRTGASGGRGGGGGDPCCLPPAQQRGAGHRGHGRLASASARERGTEATSACRVTGQRLHVREHRYRKPAERGPQAGAGHRGHGLRVCEHEGDTDPRETRQICEGWSGSGGSSSRLSAASRYRRLPARRSARSGGPVAGFAGGKRRPDLEAGAGPGSGIGGRRAEAEAEAEAFAPDYASAAAGDFFGGFRTRRAVEGGRARSAAHRTRVPSSVVQRAGQPVHVGSRGRRESGVRRRQPIGR
ncbi:hypothetical protein PVAP13_2KG449810 [Panicum virgatum]|uniref:Uncharacterized protein n=1 Tax=Panicum virgatum TaxID=38727 RepID=A0A8T0WKL8_PANVG|nr:hypothetical protein PVAP13_2KG449810 [Panicum virgatum]